LTALHEQRVLGLVDDDLRPEADFIAGVLPDHPVVGRGIEFETVDHGHESLRD